MRSSMKSALNLAFNIADPNKADNINSQHWSTALRVLRKLNLEDNLANLVDLRINNLGKNNEPLEDDEIELLEKEHNNSIGYHT